jgi:ankyrin repeat protein
MGRFPLMQAAIFGYVECIHTCVAKGAALKQTDHRGMTALMAAASTGQAGAVAALLACGADPLQVRPFVNECAPQAGGMRSTRCKKGRIVR